MAVLAKTCSPISMQVEKQYFTQWYKIFVTFFHWHLRNSVIHLHWISVCRVFCGCIIYNVGDCRPHMLMNLLNCESVLVYNNLKSFINKNTAN